MTERIDIFVPDSILAQNDEKRERLQKTQRLEPTDRAPVVADFQLWALLAGRGGRFSELTAGPREHLRGQILNWKYRYEFIRDDLPIDTERLTVGLDFGALRGVEFPLEVVFQGDDQPKIIHLLHEPEDIDRLAVPDPYSGHNRQRIDWQRAMRALAEDFDVRLNGERLALEIPFTHPGGPIPSAFALCGANLFLWIALDPARVHRLLEITTQSHLNCLKFTDELNGTTEPHPVWLGADTGEMMRAAHFREFVVPYYRRIWEVYPRPRIFHMCGKIDHILESLRDDLQIDSLDGFGFPADKERLGAVLGGRMALRGGPHPALIHDGPAARVIAEARDYLQTVGARGGYILSEGFGIQPGTPPAHIEALVEASRRVGAAGAA